MTQFKNPLDPDNIQIRMAIRKWLIDCFKLDESARIEIVEHRCSEASCVHAETVISVAYSDDTSRDNREGVYYYKISKPLVFIRKIDVSLIKVLTQKPQVHRH